jgi:hypothetical protein
MIPKTLTLNMMYRDACNFKDCDSYVMTNKKGFTEKEIEDAIEKIADNGVIPAYYGITNHNAKMQNEFLPVPDGGIDHSFTEICDAEFDSPEVEQGCDDIGDVIDAINNPALVLERRKIALKEAITELENNISELKKMKL